MVKNKIKQAYNLLHEVAREIANNQNKQERYKEEILESMNYQTLCEIDNLCMDIRVMSGISKSKKTREERAKKYAREL